MDEFLRFAQGVANRELSSATLFDERSAHRFSIYQNNFQLNGLETLMQTFPLTYQVLGDEMFREFGFDYIAATAATEPNRELWGSQFPIFLNSKVSATELAFVTDFTNLELQLFEVLRRPHKPAQSPQRTIELLEQDQALSLQPSLRLREYSWNVNELYEAVLDEKIKDHTEFQIRTESVQLAAWSDGYSPKYATLTARQFAILQDWKLLGWEKIPFETPGLAEVQRVLNWSVKNGLVTD